MMFTKCCARRSRHFLPLSLVSREHSPKDPYPNVQPTGSQRHPLSVPVVIAHGLLGAKTNWNIAASSIATNILQKVYAVDMRNHGESPHSESMNYEVMADDLVEFIRQKQYNRISLVGHSMGGKAVMAVALREPSIVEKLVVVDASPSHGKQSRGGQLRFLLEAMIRLDVKAISSKTQADEMLRKEVPDDTVRSFLLTNLIRPRGADSFQWKCNLPILYKSLPTIIDFPQFNSTFTGKTLFIRGAKSDAIGDEQKAHIKRLFPSAEITTLDTGHWVHAEKPNEFTEIVTHFLTD